MDKIVIAGAVLASIVAVSAATTGAAAIPVAPRMALAPVTGDAVPILKIHYACRCARQWLHRQYWQWDDRPIWDDPWRVLKPNFWESPEPHLVPADIWACKWHLPARSWRWRHRQCRPWHKAGAVNE
jgi:hypothetical protein